MIDIIRKYISSLDLFVLSRKYRTLNGFLAIFFVFMLTIGYVWTSGWVLRWGVIIGFIVACFELLLKPALDFVFRNPLFKYGGVKIRKYFVFLGLLLFVLTLIGLIFSYSKNSYFLISFLIGACVLVRLINQIKAKIKEFILCEESIFSGEYTISVKDRDMFYTYGDNLLLEIMLNWSCFSFFLIIFTYDLLLGITFTITCLTSYYSIHKEISNRVYLWFNLCIYSLSFSVLYVFVSKNYYSLLNTYDLLMYVVVDLIVYVLYYKFYSNLNLYLEQKRLLYKVGINLKAR